jgi:hypothetical protein
MRRESRLTRSKLLDAIIDPWFVVPDFIIELIAALWLTIKGANLTVLPRRSVDPAYP